jgi:hypothetical protein
MVENLVGNMWATPNRAIPDTLPFERPALQATASVIMGDDFASRLDKAIERSRISQRTFVVIDYWPTARE